MDGLHSPRDNPTCDFAVGSTSVVADRNGNEVGYAIYDPYGGVISSTLGVTVTERLFKRNVPSSGIARQRWDATIGLYDYAAPETVRSPVFMISR